jgi:ATP-dependent DNA helicase RecG
MLIEHAERFGLTQLHQLRGRVGRGKNKSFCILVRRSFSENAKKRLNIMEETNDGFVIADEDLKIRGPGEFFGIRQSGYLSFKIANMKTDGSLIQKARKLAKEIIKHDSNLEGRKNIELKNKLYKTYKQNLNEKIIS